MKITEILNKTLNTINEVTPLLADCINVLSEKILIANGENVDNEGNVLYEDTDHEEVSDENLEKMSTVENQVFNALGNLIRAKEALGAKLEFHEVMLKTQYEYEMGEAMEMYREYKNMEEILNDDKEDKTEEQ